MTVLDLTSLPPQVADQMLALLGPADVSATEWFAIPDQHAYLATTVHHLGGVTVTAHTIAEFSELAGDDWRLVEFLTQDEWDDYLNSAREAA